MSLLVEMRNPAGDILRIAGRDSWSPGKSDNRRCKVVLHIDGIRVYQDLASVSPVLLPQGTVPYRNGLKLSEIWAGSVWFVRNLSPIISARRRSSAMYSLFKKISAGLGSARIKSEEPRYR